MPTPEAGPVYDFFDFRLDCGRFELLRSGHPLRVERKPMELLILLASREGQLVTRAEIAQRLWSSEVFVDTEHGINTAIRKLRYSLRDDPDAPRFIQTVTGRGYRFIAPIAAVVPAPVAPAAVTPAAVAPLAPLPQASPVSSPAAVPDVTREPAHAPPAASKRKLPGLRYLSLAAAALLALAAIALYRSRHRPPQVTYTQLTDFTDSAVAPALSPDGHMLAFIRGSQPFLSSDQIYVKMLPNGEATRVADDPRPKYGLAFSPDESQIAYTVLETARFSTWEVSPLGGEPHLLLDNAAGLVWLDPQRLLFSEIRPGEGIHMGVVTATPTRSGLREIYFPAHQRGMAHNAFPSPDRHWALVVEMNGNGDWAPCRLVALDPPSPPAPAAPSRSAGPAGACSSAGWSPDGRWMYFTARVQGRSHLWRQHFPDGQPEQITSGPTQEDGIAVEPAGNALITSVGVQESALWIHDQKGDRPLSSEGEVVKDRFPPVFSPDATSLYYLLQRGDSSAAELWRTAVDSGKSEAVFPGISITDFALSPDGKQVVYTTTPPNGITQLWLAPVDRSSPATRVAVAGASAPRFGPRGRLLFQHAEGTANYIEQIDPDGAHRSKLFPFPIDEFQGISPGGHWVTAAVPQIGERELPHIVAIPLDGSPPRRLCTSYCFPAWSTNGKFLFVPVEDPSRGSAGRTLAIPLGPSESLPSLPPGGIAPLAQPNGIPGAESISRAQLVPGKDPDHYAWVNATVHRNLYRITLP